MKHISNQIGFSLVEVLITASIMTILFLVLGNSFLEIHKINQRTTENQNAQVFVNELSQILSARCKQQLPATKPLLQDNNLSKPLPIHFTLLSGAPAVDGSSVTNLYADSIHLLSSHSGSSQFQAKLYATFSSPVRTYFSRVVNTIILVRDDTTHQIVDCSLATSANDNEDGCLEVVSSHGLTDGATLNIPADAEYVSILKNQAKYTRNYNCSDGGDYGNAGNTCNSSTETSNAVGNIYRIDKNITFDNLSFSTVLNSQSIFSASRPSYCPYSTCEDRLFLNSVRIDERMPASYGSNGYCNYSAPSTHLPTAVNVGTSCTNTTSACGTKGTNNLFSVVFLKAKK